jgi:hypothetical protein
MSFWYLDTLFTFEVFKYLNGNVIVNRKICSVFELFWVHNKVLISRFKCNEKVSMMIERKNIKIIAINQ